MEQLTLHLTGTAPLLVHAPRTVDPFDPIARKMKEFTSKRKKVDEDHKIIQRLEWEAGLYHNDEIGPYVPGVNVEICLRDAGKLTKQGANVVRAVVVTAEHLPIQFSGRNGHAPTIRELWDGNYKDYRPVGNQKNRVMRCRPMFPGWSLDVPVALETELMNPETLRQIARQAGLMIGLGDYRPRFGRFEVG